MNQKSLTRCLRLQLIIVLSLFNIRVTFFNFSRINSLQMENSKLKVRLDDVCRSSETKHTMLKDAERRVSELEKQVETKNIEYTAYKEKARKVLQVSFFLVDMINQTICTHFS